MARNKTEFGRPVQSPEDVPDYLKKYYRKLPFLVNGTIDDFGWYGDDGNWDPKPIVDEITAPAGLLRLVVLAIIGGNPSTDKSASDRVEVAMRALLGTGGRKGRRHLSSDEHILRRMAVEFLQGFHKFKVSHQSLNALAEWALQAEPGFAEYGEERKDNRRRTIARKFRKSKDRLLVEVSSGYDMEVQLALARVKSAVMALDDLGVRLHLPNGDRTE